MNRLSFTWIELLKLPVAKKTLKFKRVNAAMNLQKLG